MLHQRWAMTDLGNWCISKLGNSYKQDFLGMNQQNESMRGLCSNNINALKFKRAFPTVVKRRLGDLILNVYTIIIIHTLITTVQYFAHQYSSFKSRNKQIGVGKYVIAIVMAIILPSCFKLSY